VRGRFEALGTPAYPYCRDSEGVPFVSLESLWPGIWQIQAKSGHVTITNIENVHIEKIHWFENAILFDLRRKITNLSRKNSFRTVASPGACGRLAVLIYARRQHMLLVRRPLRYNALTTEPDKLRPGNQASLLRCRWSLRWRDSLHQPLHGWRDTASAGHGNPE